MEMGQVGATSFQDLRPNPAQKVSVPPNLLVVGWE